MKTLRVVIFGGNGAIGRRISAEACRRGHAVTVVGRSAGGPSTMGESQLVGDMRDRELVVRLLADADVVISAIGPGRSEESPGLLRQAINTVTAHLDDRVRLMVVGGAGTLISDRRLLADLSTTPGRCRKEARSHIEVLSDLYCAPTWVKWTCLTPAPRVTFGTGSGGYVTSANNPAGAHISAEDLAVAAIDELEKPCFLRTRFTVAACPEEHSGMSGFSRVARPGRGKEERHV